jgi:hypothetical protein
MFAGLVFETTALDLASFKIDGKVEPQYPFIPRFIV